MKFFRSDHKYDTVSGFPSFWNHIVDAVSYKEDHVAAPPKVVGHHEEPIFKNKVPLKRATCSNVTIIIAY